MFAIHYKENVFNLKHHSRHEKWTVEMLYFPFTIFPPNSLNGKFDFLLLNLFFCWRVALVNHTVWGLIILCGCCWSESDLPWMALNATKLVLAIRLLMGSRIFALHHYGVACITSCGTSGMLVHFPEEFLWSYLFRFFLRIPINCAEIYEFFLIILDGNR